MPSIFQWRILVRKIFQFSSLRFAMLQLIDRSRHFSLPAVYDTSILRWPFVTIQSFALFAMVPRMLQSFAPLAMLPVTFCLPPSQHLFASHPTGDPLPPPPKRVRGIFFVWYSNGYMHFCLVWVFDIYCVMDVKKVSCICTYQLL